MNAKKITKYFLIVSIGILIFFSYYYLPSQNKGSIKLENKTSLEKIENQTNITKNPKNTFKNTEYKSRNEKGQIFTTKAEESYVNQDKNDLIYLIKPYSFTKLEKDQSLIEIFSEKGLFDKEKKITVYEKKVLIKNKNYLITADFAKHFSQKNMIFISGNVIMKDLTQGLSHIAYCDMVEINTISNDAVAYMNSPKDRVVTKKFK